MLNEPELQASMRQQLINPLRLAWGLVIFLAWAFLSDEDQTTSKIASKNSITINTLINSEDENISKIITTYPITVVIDEVEEPKNKKLKTQLTSQQKIFITKPLITKALPILNTESPQQKTVQVSIDKNNEIVLNVIGNKSFDFYSITRIIQTITGILMLSVGIFTYMQLSKNDLLKKVNTVPLIVLIIFTINY